MRKVVPWSVRGTFAVERPLMDNCMNPAKHLGRPREGSKRSALVQSDLLRGNSPNVDLSSSET